MTQNKEINRLEVAPIGKLLVQFSLPAIVSMIIVSLYNIISSIFIGQGVGPLAIAGLAVTFPFMNLVFSIMMMVAIGGATVCSIALGQKDLERAHKVLGHNVVLSLLFAVGFSIICLIFIDPLLFLFGASDATITYAREYMEVILISAPIGNLMVALNHFMRASGYPARSMWLSLISVGVNIILTPIFIYWFHWGIRGAAIATVVSQAVSLAGMIVHYLNKNSTVQFKRGIFKLEMPIVKSMLSVGMAPFLMNFCACIVVLVINVSLRTYGGDLSIGAYGVANRLLMLFAMIVIGLTQGMQPIIGYNFGARCMDRVRQTVVYGLVVAIAVSICGFLAFQLFADELARLFTTDAVLIDMASNALRLTSIMFFMVGPQIVITSLFQSMGKAPIAIFLSLSRQLVFLIPGLIILPLFLGLNGVWLSLPLADTLALIIAVLILLKAARDMKKYATPGDGGRS